jgi:hypothetical protein
MPELIAIDVLVLPDDATVERAREVNARLRESEPGGFAFDETHPPHLTTVQCYVRVRELERVLDAVEQAVAGTDLAALAYEAVGIGHVDWEAPGIGYAMYVVQSSTAVPEFQLRVARALGPFTESGGTAAAFFTDAADPEINEATVRWVERFAQDQVGPQYTPHLALGFATLDDLALIEGSPFTPFAIHALGVAVYQLGNNGNARREIRAWPAFGPTP